jgi:hypothetical protein
VPVFRKMYYKTNGTTLFSLVTSSAAELFRKGYEVMSDHTRLMVRTQGNGSGAYHIRLDLGHPDHHRASRLLSACGGREIFEWAGTVYRFITIVARDNALDLVRSKMGYTVASPFDGRTWSRCELASRNLQCCNR